MEKSIKSAFTSMFKDQNWLLKVVILALLMLPTMAIKDIWILYSKIPFESLIFKGVLRFSIFMTFIVTSCLTMGYANKYSNIVMNTTSEEQPDLLLPCWKNNLWEYSKSGFLLYFATYLLGIIGFAVLFLGTYNKILAGILSTVLSIFMVVLLLMSLAIHAVFCIDFKLKSFFAWKKAFKLISFAPWKYLLILLITGFTTVIVSLIGALTAFSPWFYILTSLVAAYFLNVWAYLKGYLFPAPPAEFFAEKECAQTQEIKESN